MRKNVFYIQHTKKCRLTEKIPKGGAQEMSMIEKIDAKLTKMCVNTIQIHTEGEVQYLQTVHSSRVSTS